MAIPVPCSPENAQSDVVDSQCLIIFFVTKNVLACKNHPVSEFRLPMNTPYGKQEGGIQWAAVKMKRSDSIAPSQLCMYLLLPRCRRSDIWPGFAFLPPKIRSKAFVENTFDEAKTKKEVKN